MAEFSVVDAGATPATGKGTPPVAVESATPTAETSQRRAFTPRAGASVVIQDDDRPTREETLKELYAEHGLDPLTGDPVGEEDNTGDEEQDGMEPGQDLAGVSAEEGEEPGSGNAREQALPANVDEWVSTIREKPARINEIPAKQRADVIQKLRDDDYAAYEAAARRAYEAGIASAKERITVEAAVAEIDQLKTDDPESYLEWAEQYPDREEAYRAHKKQLRGIVDPRVEAQNAILTQARVVLGKVTQPDALERVKAAGPFPPTAEGLAKLEDAVLEELAEQRAQAKVAQGQPARKGAAMREQAVAGLKNTPKPNIGGASPDGELTFESLKTMSTEEIMRLQASPEGQARIKRALSSAP